MQIIETDFYVNIKCNIKIMSYTHKGKKIYVHVVHKSKIYQKTYTSSEFDYPSDAEDDKYEWYWNTFTTKQVTFKKPCANGYTRLKWEKKEYSCDGWTGCNTEDLEDLKDKYFTYIDDE
jgi:hypothetical protein